MKKNLLFLTICMTVIFLGLLLLEETIKSNFCGSRDIICWENYNLLLVILLLSPALLTPALIAQKVSDVTFNEWKRVTYYFIPAYIIIITLMPWSVGDEIAGFTKGMTGLVLCIGYALFSVAYLLKNKQRE